MVVMKRFFFWFSMRLGAIIVGISSLIQAAIWLMVSLITIKNQEDVRDFLGQIAESLHIENKLFLAIADDPHVLLIILAAFSAIFLVSCVLLIGGSLMCKHKLLYPFLVVDMIYINFMLVLTTMLLIYFKKNGFGLGSLILASNLGALGLLILVYMWICVLGLIQIINDLRCEIAENRILFHDGQRQMKRLIDMRYQSQPNNYTTTE